MGLSINRACGVALVVVFGATIVACPDNVAKDGEDGAAKDATAPAPDLTSPYPDRGVLAVCEQQCLDEKPYLCVSSVTSSSCVQCLEDKHCAGNPDAFGNRCTDTAKGKTSCTCAKDAHCSSNNNGLKCSLEHHRCHCESDEDCLAPRRCLGAYLETMVCQIPCHADADCLGSPDGHRCETAKGRCVSCTSMDHCLDNPDGLTCDDGQCVCLDNQGCQGAYSWGNICDSSMNQCGCTTEAACGASAHGPVCNLWYQKCTCERDDQCITAPYTKCALPYASASYTHCQVPCTTTEQCKRTSSAFVGCADGKCVACTNDTNCSDLRPFCNPSAGMCVKCRTDQDCSTDDYAPHCLVQSGECVECKTTSHCSANMFLKTCLTDYNYCVECQTDEHCGPDSLGNKCSGNICICSTDADCASRNTGTRCDPDLSACSCLTDLDCPAGGTCTGSFLSMKFCL